MSAKWKKISAGTAATAAEAHCAMPGAMPAAETRAEIAEAQNGIGIAAAALEAAKSFFEDRQLLMEYGLLEANLFDEERAAVFAFSLSIFWPKSTRLSPFSLLPSALSDI